MFKADHTYVYIFIDIIITEQTACILHAFQHALWNMPGNEMCAESIMLLHGYEICIIDCDGESCYEIIGIAIVTKGIE